MSVPIDSPGAQAELATAGRQAEAAAAVSERPSPEGVSPARALAIVGAIIFGLVFIGMISHLAGTSGTSTSTLARPSPPSCSRADITIDKLRGRSDEFGYAHVTGRVKNGCAEAIGVQLKATFYGKNDEILSVQDFWPASVSNIPARSSYPFEWMERVNGFQKYTVEVINVKTW
jgi:hypothetical protein